MREDVRPLVARVSELAGVLARLYPDAAPEPPPRYDSDPPVLALLRRRREDEVRLLERFVGPAEPVLPLVRQKPERPSTHARDAMNPTEVLEATYRGHADATRALFEKILAPVGVRAPWAPP